MNVVKSISRAGKLSGAACQVRTFLLTITRFPSAATNHYELQQEKDIGEPYLQMSLNRSGINSILCTPALGFVKSLLGIPLPA
jgi:hypothetical protein